ncbi:hypothetical protein E2C01_071192 [Portunus trituberculatus]|uniref:Uncharacterized protein n=1 Tax=Portunus trituberculatus TaxID=210409 RepID=A0A5B7I3C1_PORTR|nr:hypothetical protein [Portunus trituberculatus]
MQHSLPTQLLIFPHLIDMCLPVDVNSSIVTRPVHSPTRRLVFWE